MKLQVLFFIQMAFIIQGVKILHKCRYIAFKYSSRFEVKTSPKTDSMIIYFKKGMTSKDIVAHGIQLIKDVVLVEQDYVKIKTPVINLNGLTFIKLAQKDLILKQFIVRGLDNFRMRFTEDVCEILIPDQRQTDIETYKKLISNNPYLQLVSADLTKIHNVDLICIRDKDITVNTTSDFVYPIKRDYDRYLLSPIMVQAQFIQQLTGIINDYGLELIRLPLDEHVASNNRIVYRYTDIGRHTSRKDNSIYKYMQSKQDHIEFTLTTPDLGILDDFKTRYQSLDLISNFTEFYSTDRLGNQYKSTVWWNSLTTDFNQDFATDNTGNIGFEASFSADVFYDTIYDEKLITIKDTINNLVSIEDNDMIII